MSDSRLCSTAQCSNFFEYCTTNLLWTVTQYPLDAFRGEFAYRSIVVIQQGMAQASQEWCSIEWMSREPNVLECRSLLDVPAYLLATLHVAAR